MEWQLCRERRTERHYVTLCPVPRTLSHYALHDVAISRQAVPASSLVCKGKPFLKCESKVGSAAFCHSCGVPTRRWRSFKRLYCAYRCKRTRCCVRRDWRRCSGPCASKLRGRRTDPQLGLRNNLQYAHINESWKNGTCTEVCLEMWSVS